MYQQGLVKLRYTMKSIQLIIQVKYAVLIDITSTLAMIITEW